MYKTNGKWWKKYDASYSPSQTPVFLMVLGPHNLTYDGKQLWHLSQLWKWEWLISVQSVDTVQNQVKRKFFNIYTKKNQFCYFLFSDFLLSTFI